jgi:ATP-binding cassette subfamily C exporter for protease/lipase
VALARALFGTPRIVVLDEPNACLDAAGEQALGDALRELRAAGYGFVAASEGDEFIIQFVQNYVPRAERLGKTAVAPPPRPARVMSTEGSRKVGLP